MTSDKQDGEQQKLSVVGWTDYDNEYFPSCDLTDEVYAVVAQEVREKDYRFGGDSHQDHSACCPVLSNGCAARFSCRGWGLVIAMAYDLRGRNGQYDHMFGYMDEMIKEDAVYRPQGGVDFRRIEDKGKIYQLVASPSQYDNYWIKKFEARIDGDELKQIKIGDYLDMKVMSDFNSLIFMDRYKVVAIFRGASFEALIEQAEERYYADSEYFGYSDELEDDQLIEQLYNDYPREQVEQHGVVLFRLASYRE